MDVTIAKMIEDAGLEIDDVRHIIEAVQQQTKLTNVTMIMREAIVAAEEFGLVRDENGSVITGAIESEHGVVLVKE